MPLYAFKVVAIQQCQIEAESIEEATEKLKDGKIDKWNTGKMTFHGYKTSLREWKMGDDLPMPPHHKPTTSGNMAEAKLKAVKKKNSQVQVAEAIDASEQADKQS